MAVKKFNRSPAKGIEYMVRFLVRSNRLYLPHTVQVAKGLSDGTPAQIAKFLRKEQGLDKTKTGAFLSNPYVNFCLSSY